ncbi:hypothetical protein BS47DRAFT_1488199 [Hydnum rufescens UP504]|uniref:Uncharacterized protein n=1 Tax=Hydnum rufescens UP504 TaxID=1448309 RepID=A0A9P6ANE5_9AGAM|nr:hypothetical protein BS47DRAFT_1488199 [Hydnum rufescens UP504]
MHEEALNVASFAKRDCIGGVEEEIRKSNVELAQTRWEDGSVTPCRLCAPISPRLDPLIYGLPILCLISVLWTFWDPTWLRRHRAMIKAIDLRVTGRKAWINFQMGAWISRLVTSFLLVFDCVPHWWPGFIIVLELSLLLLSAYVIKVVHPPSVRLTQSGPQPPTPYATTMIPKPSNIQKTSLPPQPDDLFSSLSLSAGPTISQFRSNPIFGQTSPLRSAPSFGGAGPNPQEVMDWTPSPSVPLDPTSSRDSESTWLRPQRFFPPSEPTGLESLLEKTNLLDPGDEEQRPHLLLRQGNGRRQIDKKPDAMTTYLVALLVAVLMGSALLLRTGSWRLLQGEYVSTKSQNYSPGQNAWHYPFNS